MMSSNSLCLSVALAHRPEKKSVSSFCTIACMGTDAMRTHAIQDRMATREAVARADASVIDRIAQESLTNAVKHSNATKVAIGLTIRRGSPPQHGVVVLHIKDNGKGLDVLNTPDGSGLQNIRHRVEALGGNFRLKSMPLLGTQVYVTIPLNNETKYG